MINNVVFAIIIATGVISIAMSVENMLPYHPDDWSQLHGFRYTDTNYQLVSVPEKYRTLKKLKNYMQQEGYFSFIYFSDDKLKDGVLASRGTDNIEFGYGNGTIFSR